MMARRTIFALLVVVLVTEPGCKKKQQSVASLTAKLRSGNANERGWAALKLAELGPRAAPAIPALIEALGDPDGRVHGPASGALIAIGEPAVGPLVEVLTDGQAQGTGPAMAVPTLATIGEPAVEPLSEIVARGDRGRLMAAQALGMMGPHGVGHLLRAASRAKDKGCWFSVSFALSQMKPAPVAELARLALAETGDVRRLALEHLGSFGARARPVSTKLIPLLASDDLATRRETVRALGRIQPTDRRLIPRLMDAVDPLDFELAREVCRLVARMAQTPGSSPATSPRWRPEPEDMRSSEAMRVYLTTGPPPDRIVDAALRLRQALMTWESVYGFYLTDMCTLALEAAGAEAPKLLLEALRTGSPGRAKAAVECLALLRPPMSDAVAELGRLAAGDSDRAVRLASMWTLRTLGRTAEGAAEALERAAGESDVQYRIEAIVSLAAVTGRADAAVRRLTTELKSDDPKARNSAAWYLGDFQAGGAPAVGPLAAALSDEYWKVREWAAMALGRIGPAARPAVEPLSRLLLGRFESKLSPAEQLALDVSKHTGTTEAQQAAGLKRLEASVRTRAASALAEIGEPEGRIRGLLLSCLTHQRPGVRAAAARALGSKPAWAGATVPKLIPLLKDPEASVRGATYMAFWELGPAARDALEPLTQAMRREKSRGNRITASIAVEKVQGK